MRILGRYQITGIDFEKSAGFEMVHLNDFHRVRWNIRLLTVSKIHLTESVDSSVTLCGVGVPPPIMRIEPHGTTSNCMRCEARAEKLVIERNEEENGDK